ncbi:polymyxin B resistance protein pmrD [Klebsiella pneumoniae]|uniref:polymyxin B resistance protein pmrD n=1 Tax=Klebsiella pneumoniae TaxID=573 RepID=UPI0018C8DAE2|nr:polymyxin B resistance protein pmrD [Salmonella enterica]QPM54997.1 polymyxin B resistance protein pmrD [Klebsiella pneumoniae]QPM60269.1 polymyxin B resistance protein pmrD [Klebsiella pneumoniae]HCF8137970.1 polymyxin B resistance protein pmrD [Klebsiella pneumoniae]HEN4892973.1 polymyxin B resistance protein pmrD [Klebsiella pneumoniae]
MERIIEGVIFLKRSDACLVKLRSSSICMIAEIAAETSVSKGDILFPVKDATYLINRDKHRTVKVLCAREFNATYWFAQKIENRSIPEI